MTRILYAVRGSPPCYAVIMCLETLGLEYTHIIMDYDKGEQKTDEYVKKNPQKEVPVLEDDGFCLSESNAILQYLVDKYGKDDKLYPKEVQARAIVNRRLCFDLSTYYRYILDYFMARLVYDKDEIAKTAALVQKSLNVYNTYLEQIGTKYCAGDNVTIADFQLVTSTMCLDSLDFDYSSHLLVKQWYATFEKENPDLWKIAEDGVIHIAKYYHKHKEGAD